MQITCMHSVQTYTATPSPTKPYTKGRECNKEKEWERCVRWRAKVQTLNWNTQLQDKKKQQVKVVFLDILISSMPICYLLFVTALPPFCQHSPIPQPTWISPGVPADKQCLLSSTITFSALAPPFFPHALSSTTSVFYLTLQGNNKAQTQAANSNYF